MISQALKMGVLNRSYKTFFSTFSSPKTPQDFSLGFLHSVIHTQKIRSLIQPHEREFKHP